MQTVSTSTSSPATENPAPPSGSAATSAPLISVEAHPDARPALLDDPRSKRILAKTIYRELKESGASERDILAIATELLGQVASDLRR